jgi:hypothetical protein
MPKSKFSPGDVCEIDCESCEIRGPDCAEDFWDEQDRREAAIRAQDDRAVDNYAFPDAGPG